MAKHKKKNKQKQKTFVDEFGNTHIVIKPNDKRNEMHFQHQLNTHSTIVESKKYKKPKHKGRLFDYE